MAYFGYGSLVNLDTLRTDYVSAHRAHLFGWKRHWQSYAGTGKDRALLSVHEDAQAALSGMLVIDHLENLPALDIREAHYRRVSLPPENLLFDDETVDLGQFEAEHLFVYVAERHDTTQPPLLQSYLDAVMAGYHEQFGESGVVNFIASTNGFARKIIQDRNSPQYPRSISLKSSMAEWFDEQLKSAGVQFD